MVTTIGPFGPRLLAAAACASVRTAVPPSRYRAAAANAIESDAAFACRTALVASPISIPNHANIKRAGIAITSQIAAAPRQFNLLGLLCMFIQLLEIRNSHDMFQ
jgi:hypothetical protein